MLHQLRGQRRYTGLIHHGVVVATWHGSFLDGSAGKHVPVALTVMMTRQLFLSPPDKEGRPDHGRLELRNQCEMALEAGEEA